MSLLATLKHFYQQHGPHRTYWVGYSGGLDSHVLLHLLAQLRKRDPIKLKAIHINHSLSPNAVAWSEHCAEVCRELQIDLHTQTINAKPEVGQSPEEAARAGRYAVCAHLLQPRDILLTAHHQDDQAETLLLQLLRGAGPKGLASMPIAKVFGPGILGRPLLQHTRQELQTYVEEHHLNWIHDESNANTHYARNFMRHEILSELKERWPSATAILSRSAAHCAEAAEVIEEVAAEDFVRVQGIQANTLSVHKLMTLSAPRQRQVLRYWFQLAAYPIPTTLKLQQIQADILYAREDKQPHLTWKSVEIRRFKDTIYIMPRMLDHDPKQSYQWQLSSPLQLHGIGELRAELTQGQGLLASIKNVEVRFRQGGETCRLAGRACHHQLKKLFQDWEIPTWERKRLPLIYSADCLVAIPGYFMDESVFARGEEMGYQLFLDKK